MGIGLASAFFLLNPPEWAEPEAFTLWLIAAVLILLGLIRRRHTS